MHTVNDNSYDKSQWYAVQCQRLKEWQAAAALEKRLELAVFLPEIHYRIAGRVRRALFFPGYLFVQANLREVALSHINNMPGILHIVSFGELPQPIPAGVVDEIRQRVNELNAYGGQMPHGFRLGDRLRIKDGPFQGLEAAFLGPMKPSERVRILLEFLGGPRETEVMVNILERVSSSTAVDWKRRTRGKGRKINITR